MYYKIFTSKYVGKKGTTWRYEIRYKDKSKKQQRETKQGFQTKRAAIAAAQARIPQLVEEAKLYTDYETLGAVFDSYLNRAIIRGVKNSTIRNIKTVRRFFNELCARPVASIKKIDIQDVMNCSEVSKSTAEGYINLLSSVFKLAVDLELIIKSPCQNIQIYQRPSPRKNKGILSPLEIKNMYGDLKQKDQQIALILLIQGTMGLRIGEAAGIRRRDIDGDVLHVAAQKDRDELKTDNSYRDVPIPPFTRSEIAAYLKALPLSIVSDALFEQSLGSIYNRANKMLKPYGITSHRLRHSYGSNAIAAKVDPATVASIMGDTIETILRTYVHATDEGRENMTKKMKELFA